MLSHFATHLQQLHYHYMTVSWFLLLTISLLLPTSVSSIDVLPVGHDTYKGYEIITVQTNSEKDMDSLRKLDLMLKDPIDYLKEPNRVRGNGDMLVDPVNLLIVKQFLTDHKILFTSKPVHIPSVRSRRQLRPFVSSNRLNEIASSYLSYDDQMRFVDETAAKYPYLARTRIIATSSEGRPIKLIQIGYPSPNRQVKPIIWIEAGIHAREWISHPVALFLIQQLTQNPRYAEAVKAIDFNIVPNVNPDGYEFSRLRHRFWRKTRSKYANNKCYGTDGNRNYPFHWNEADVSGYSCSEIYPGPFVASEPEVSALVREITAQRWNIKAYISLHSYGQRILYPWGHQTHTYPVDVEDLKSLANRMVEAIRNYDDTVYEVMNAGDGLYPASGASDDWAKSMGVKYSYTIELSPPDFNQASQGFLLEESQISRVCNEVLRAFDVLINQVMQEFVVRPTNFAPKYRKPNPQYFLRRRAKTRRITGRVGRVRNGQFQRKPN